MYCRLICFRQQRRGKRESCVELHCRCPHSLVSGGLSVNYKYLGMSTNCRHILVTSQLPSFHRSCHTLPRPLSYHNFNCSHSNAYEYQALVEFIFEYRTSIVLQRLDYMRGFQADSRLPVRLLPCLYHGWPSTQPDSLHTALQRKYTQPCALFSRGTAMWTMGARLCQQWGTAVCRCPAV